MAKIGIEWDEKRQAELAMPLGERELYPYSGMFCGEALKEYGVTVAFGVPGGHIWQLIDGISRIGIKMITFAHEQNGVYAAEAYSQVARRPGVCYGTVGPGVGNAVSPINQAWLSRSPIFFICGGHEIEHDKLYNTIQEAYASEVCSTISKWAQRITYPNTIKQFFTRGLKLAMEFPYGPVVMEIGISCMFTPKEANDRVWYGAWGEHATWRPDWRHGKENQPILSAGAPEDIAEVVNAIYKAEKPFGMLGDGAHWSDCGPELLEFFRMAKIPFTTRRLGRGTIDETDPLCMRGMAFKKEIDLVVPVGVEIGFFDGYGGKWNQAVQIAESSDMIYTYVDTVGAIVGNPKIVAQQMIDYAKANNLTPPPGRDEWIKKCQDADVAAIAKRRKEAEYYANLPRYKENNFMHHLPLCQMTADYIAEKFNNDCRYFIDGYTMSGVVMPYLVCVKSAQILTASTYAGVGHGIGQSVGAAIAQLEMGDKAPLLALMGDGGMGNAMMDIEVAARYQLPIVYQVTNNDGWMPGSKYNWYGENWEGLGDQETTGNKWHGIEQMGEERLHISYENIAKELGCYAETVTKHEDYVAALDRCFQSALNGKPAVLDCIMDKHLVNGAVTNPVYALMYQHLPWVDLPERGKRVRRAIWGKEKAFKGLAKYPPCTVPNFLDPFEEAEMEIIGEDFPMEKWPYETRGGK